MRRILIALVIVACGGSAPPKSPAPSPPPADVGTEIKAFADKGCACTDAACGRTVVESFVGWVNTHRDGMADERQTHADSDQLFTCVKRAGLTAEELGDLLKKLDI